MTTARSLHWCPIRRGMVFDPDFATGALYAICQRRYPIDSDVFDCHYLGCVGHPDFVDSDRGFCIDAYGIRTCDG